MSESETVVARGRRSLPAAIACLALLALPIAGCGGDDEGQKSETRAAPAKDSVEVNIASFKFVSDPVRVKAGGKVTWVNQDKAPHTAETDDGMKDGFDTKRLDLGGKKAVRFERAGKFSYFCVYHRFMTGTVEVVE